MTLLARGVRGGGSGALAVTAASSRNGSGTRYANIRARLLLEEGLEDLATPRRHAPMPVVPFLAHVIDRAAVANNVQATEVATVGYQSGGAGIGQTMTFIAFIITSVKNEGNSY